MRGVFWIVVVLALLRPHSSLHMEIYNQYLADSGMFVSGHDGSPPIELEYEEYYTTKRTTTSAPTTTTSVSTTTSSVPITTSNSILTTASLAPNPVTTITPTSEAPEEIPVFHSLVKAHSASFAAALLIILMIFLFVVLWHINSDSYRRLHSQELRENSMVLENHELESIAVLDVANNQIDISLMKFAPRGVDGHILSVLREESQE